MRIAAHRSARAVLAVVLAATGLVAGCSIRSGPAQAGSRALDSAVVARLDAAIDAVVAAEAIPGALIGIWSPDGEYIRASGVADTATDSPVKTDFYSRIGSVTKTFTATALLLLVDRGEVDLESPIADYLDGIPDGEAITVGQLATMRSGLAEYTETDGFQAAMRADPSRSFTPRELLALAFAEPPIFPPGQGWRYSNTNYVLLGLLVEKLGGAALGDYLTQNVLEPLGMRDTSFPTATQFPDPHPRGYTDPLESGGPPLDATGWTASFTWAAGAMISTLEDLRLWAPALASGSLIGPELHAQQLTIPAVPGLPAGVGYGIGVFITAGWIGHNGSVPGYQTVVIHLPQRSMTVAVMVNTDITPPDGPQPSTAVAKAITSVLTPANVYDV